MGQSYNPIVAKALVDQVWATARNFHNFDRAPGVIESMEPQGTLRGNQVGAQRVLNGVFHATLLELRDPTHTVQHSIDDGPGPVSQEAVKSCVGTLHLSPVTSDNSTFVEWTSRCDSQDDSAVGEFCNPICQALLGGLQSHCAWPGPGPCPRVRSCHVLRGTPRAGTTGWVVVFRAAGQGSEGLRPVLLLTMWPVSSRPVESGSIQG